MNEFKKKNILFFKKLLSFNKKGTFSYIFTISCIPILVCSFLFIINHNLYTKNNRKTIINNYQSDLNACVRETRNSIENILNNIISLSENQTIRMAMTANTRPDNISISTVSDNLISFTARTSIVDKIAIVNKNTKTVFTTNGVYDIDTYFSKTRIYSDYPTDFWINYSDALYTAKPLTASIVMNSSGTTQTVIPVVYRSIGNIPSNSLIILDINLKNLYNLASGTYPEAAQLYMLDHNKYNCFDGEKFINSPFSDNSLISNIVKLSNTSVFENTTINEKKYTLVTTPIGKNIWGFIYILAIPDSTLTNYGNTFTILLSIVTLFSALILIFSAYFSARKIYSPIEKLALSIDYNKKTGENSNIIEYIEDSIKNIAEHNRELKRELSSVLPLSQEKYIIDILNNPHTSRNTDFETTAFKHPYFLSIAFKVSFSQSFATVYSGAFREYLITSMPEIIRGMFDPKYTSFVLPSTNNVLYLLFNIEHDDCIEEIDKNLNEIRSIFAADSEYIDVIFTRGNIHKGIDGLRKTHKEALSALFETVNSNMLQIPLNDKEQYSFDISSENILTNYLIAGYTEKADNFITDIADRSSMLADYKQKQIFADVASTIFRVLKSKGISYCNDVSKTDAELINELNKMPHDKRLEYLFSLTKLVSENMQTSNTKVNIGAVIEYINIHYTEDLYLDDLAARFNTVPKYLSKRIKQYLNMSFRDYLAKLRIDHAKEILETTDTKLTDLYLEAGFSNRSAFVRAFKNKVGLTPSEYKNLIKSSK